MLFINIFDFFVYEINSYEFTIRIYNPNLQSSHEFT